MKKQHIFELFNVIGSKIFPYFFNRYHCGSFKTCYEVTHGKTVWQDSWGTNANAPGEWTLSIQCVLGPPRSTGLDCAAQSVLRGCPNTQLTGSSDVWRSGYPQLKM